MDADQLAETTMDPRHRTLRRVTLGDAEIAERVFELLMGNDVAPRKDFIVAGCLRQMGSDRRLVVSGAAVAAGQLQHADDGRPQERREQQPGHPDADDPAPPGGPAYAPGELTHAEDLALRPVGAEAAMAQVGQGVGHAGGFLVPGALDRHTAMMPAAWGPR